MEAAGGGGPEGPKDMHNTTDGGGAVPVKPPQKGGGCKTSFNLFDRPEGNTPGIYCRGSGRQIFITTGQDLNPDLDTDLSEPGTEREDEEQTPPAKRGKCHGYGESPRRRMRERVHAIRRDATGLFLTLTYQDKRPSPERVKKDLEAFWAWLEREYNGEHVQNISCIWKMEPQERGMPHFHLIVYGVPFIPVQKASRRWHEITNQTGDAHRKSGVEIETAVNQDGRLQGYLAGYMTKMHDHWPGAEPGDEWWDTGRWWGKKGEAYLPIAEWEDTVVKLHQKEAMNLIEWLLEDWGVDLPDGVIPPSLIVNCRGNPGERLLGLIDAIP